MAWQGTSATSDMKLCDRWLLVATPLELAWYVGRIQTIMVFRLTGIGALLVIGGFPALWRRPWAIMAAYVLRTAGQASVYAVTRSLLMDYVPKVRALR